MQRMSINGMTLISTRRRRAGWNFIAGGQFEEDRNGGGLVEVEDDIFDATVLESFREVGAEGVRFRIEVEGLVAEVDGELVGVENLGVLLRLGGFHGELGRGLGVLDGLVALFGFGRSDIDVGDLLFEGGGDDEEDEEHAEDVDQRNDVNLDAAAAGGVELHRGRTRGSFRRALPPCRAFSGEASRGPPAPRRWYRPFC